MQRALDLRACGRLIEDAAQPAELECGRVQSNSPGGGCFLSARTIELLRQGLVGQDPFQSEKLWQQNYRRFTYLGARGLPTVALSGVDMALWDIKGKALGLPVYDLLGGKLRDSIRLYANGWFFGCNTPDQYGAAAKATVEAGHEALKLDPFLEMQPFHTGYLSGQISAEGEELGCAIVQAVREAVGEKVEILIDAHGHYNVPTAIRLANRLYEESQIAWFEEPVPPESIDALRQVREHVTPSICVGERLFTRFDVLPILQQGLADYLMPDVLWTGGITELRKIASMAEAYYVPMSPHNAMGPLQIVAGSHVMMNTPNFYRLEHSTSFIEAYNRLTTEPMNFHGGEFSLSGKPGLGVDFDMEALRAHLHPQWS